MMRTRAEVADEIRNLQRARGADRFLQFSLVAFVALLLASFAVGDFAWADLASPRRLRNVTRFFGEMRPFPLQGQEWDTRIAVEWARELLLDRGLEAALQTLAISLVAISLAGIAGLLLALPAARTFSRPDAWSSHAPSSRRAARAAWWGLFAAARALSIALRAMPEYIWAFLLLALLGPTPWVAVLALALHNAGVLGRLGAETLENAEPHVFESLRGLGATRSQIVGFAAYPVLLPRYLLLYFYRWETSAREATVLGMLGIASLGYWIEEARARGQTDVLMFLVLMGSAIVLLGDAISGFARSWVRRAS